ncbi:hypothetical protein HDU89_000355 [Geranomyces variabilis]|nr:hypothetical protein HDU89_000355 [Geranomyces variabilis]
MIPSTPPPTSRFKQPCTPKHLARGRHRIKLGLGPDSEARVCGGSIPGVTDPLPLRRSTALPAGLTVTRHCYSESDNRSRACGQIALGLEDGTFITITNTPVTVMVVHPPTPRRPPLAPGEDRPRVSLLGVKVDHRKTGGGAPATILFTSPDASENMAPALAVLRESAPRPPPQDVMTAAGFWGVQLILGDVRDVVPHAGYDCPTPTPIIIMRNWCEALGVPIVSVEY